MVLAAIPVTARAEDTLTALATDTTTITVTAPPVDLAQQVRLLTLIERRAGKADVSTQSGFIAMNPDGTPLWRNRANTPLMPASTMKVVTAAVALHVLGPNWKPVTTVTYDTATRTIALVGGGDALLSSSQLAMLAAQTVETLTAASEVPARLVIDDSLFPQPTIQDGVTSGQLPSEERPVRALVVDRRKTNDSAMDAGKKFRELLAKEGVLVPLKGRGTAAGEPVATVRGLRLRSSLNSMLIYSDNDIAEMTFRLSAVGAGKSASWADARATAYSTLSALGVPTKSLRLIDGSGLSRSNRLTPSALATVLKTASGDARMGILESLLPAAGVDGTLRKRYASGPAACVAGILRAKTGSLHDVIALAGYAPASDGTTRAFAMIVNKVPNSTVARNKTRASLDAIAAAFSGC